MSWLLDTLVWTAGLIALILVLRRPVSRWFGPQAAYALWALPILRLILPPVELPARFAPEPAAQTSVTYFTVGPVEEAARATTASAEVAPGFDWLAILLAAWLTGAVAFLAIRFGNYFRMRATLLEDAVPVGEDGKVRLVETLATSAPLAFGVFDKVVALPKGFMASLDRTQRDLALEHELAHHRGHDLLANMLAQPLFALHWFNPLGYAGWQAMRRDQEAACDARVVAQRPRAERATYGEVIASFAAGPNHALAAPMACPVLGDKSIIHRLRSLNMSDVSRRRRFAGRGLLLAGLVALPLTASVTYADSLDFPAPPAPPIAPLAPSAPTAPLAPEAPEAPDAPGVEEHVEIITLDGDDVDIEAGDGERRVMVIRRDGEHTDEHGEVKHESHVERRIITRKGERLSDEERARIMEEIEEAMGDLDEARGEMREARRMAFIEMERAGGEHRTKVEVRCDNNTDSGGGTWTSEDGKTVAICSTQITASALEGLREAREEIASSTELDEEIRAQVLRSIDQQIERWSEEG